MWAVWSAIGVAANADQLQPLYGMRPILEGHTTLSGGHFSYALPAGTQFSDAVEVVNFSPGPLIVDLYPANLVTTLGAPSPGQPGQPPTGATPWISISRATLNLAPNSTTDDRFTIAIPAGVAPGDYFAAVVGVLAGGPREAGGLVLETRVALIVQVTIPGRVEPGIRLGPLKADRHGNSEVLSVQVTNVGNTLTNLSGEVDIHTTFGHRNVALGPIDTYVIPGGHTVLTGRWRGLPFVGQAHLAAAVTAAPPGRPVTLLHTATVHAWLIPWRLVAVVAGLGVILLASRRRLRAWRTRRSDERQVVSAYRASQRTPQT